MKRLLAILAGLAVLGLSVRLLLVATGPLDHLGGRIEEWFLVDDSYYCLNIARNIARGEGWTHDGIHPTSGFQPLWVFALVPAFWAADDADRTTPVYAGLVALAVLNAGAGVWLGLVVFELTRRRWLAALGAAAFQLSPYLIGTGVNGMETSLALFVCGWAIWYHLRHRGEPLAWRRIVPLGVLLGVGLWARLDTAVLAVALGFDVLNLAWRAGRRRAGVVRLAGLAAVTVALYAPFMALSYEETGTWLPESGPAVRQLSRLAKAPRDEMLADYLSLNLRKAAALALLSGPFLPDTRVVAGPYRDYYGWVGRTLAVNGPLALLLAGGVWWWRRRRREAPLRTDALQPLALYAALMVLAYACYVFGDHYFERYLYPVTWLSLAFVLFLVHAIPRRAGRVAVAAVLGAVAVFDAVVELDAMLDRDNRPPHWGASQVRAKAELEPGLAPGERVGAFQTGYFSYWNRNERVPIVNLDGVVNGAAYRAIRDRRMAEYLREERIRYVIDWPVAKALLMQSGVDIRRLDAMATYHNIAVLPVPATGSAAGPITGP